MEASPGNAEGQQKESKGLDAALSAELKEELRLARRCFAQIERLTQLMAGYPPGHPMVEEGISKLNAAFYEYFEVTDRLTVQIHPHWMDLFGSGEAVWETQEPKDYCFALNRDGVYLLHILAGVNGEELQLLVEVFNQIVDQRDLDEDAASMLFDAGFRNIHFEAIDESLAQLAGLESDIKNRDTPEEQEMVEQLFEGAFEGEDLVAEEADAEMMEGDFEIRLEGRANQQLKLEVGSRHFLDLSEEAREHLKELKRGFQEHNELEHRQGEVLSAVLGAKPRRKLRRQAVAQIGKVMGELLETEEPWEALSFLKLIHQWRDKFQKEVAGELKEVVKECFTTQRVQALAKQAAIAEKGPRRAILQMFNALHLEGAPMELARLLALNLEEDARSDLLLYVEKQARQDLSFVAQALEAVPGDKAGPLVTILVKAMPRSRPMLVKLVGEPVEPGLKVQVLKALRGSWADATEIRDYLVPLVKGSHSELRVLAAQSLGDSVPKHVYRVMEPIFTPQLTKRPEEEVVELMRVFVDCGGDQAVDKLKELIKRKKGVSSEEEQELAVKLIQALIKAPTPKIVEMLESVAGDWLVAGRIRSECKDAVQLIKG